MMQQFKSMNELVAYLGGLEERMKHLEAENQRLRAAPSSQAEMNEMVEYLGGLEKRMKYLEAENERLHSAPSSQTAVDDKAVAKLVAYFLPQTNVIHPSFLKRAFAIWGHTFVAGLIIGIPFTLLYFCVVFWAFSQMGQTP